MNSRKRRKKSRNCVKWGVFVADFNACGSTKLYVFATKLWNLKDSNEKITLLKMI